MQGFWRRSYRRTTVALLGSTAFLLGVGFAHQRLLQWGMFAWLLLVWTIVAVCRTYTIAVVLVVMCGFCLGWARGTQAAHQLAKYQPYYGLKTTIVASALDDAVYGKNSQLSFDAGHASAADSSSLAGKLQVSGFGPTAVYQGDVVKITGRLYPGRGQYQARLSFATLEIIEHHPSLIANIRRRFATGVQSALPEPLASFAMGLLIGQRATLPPEIKQDLLMVGLTHIIAVSGYNLTIMLHASRRLLSNRSKRLATMLSLSFVALFLLLTGSSASIVRAAIVSTLSITATYYGRQFKPLNLIMLAAAVTAYANPFYVWADLGWYLSFLAFYGVLLMAPRIQARLSAGWKRSLVLSVALESVCAELMTIPLVLHAFGQISLIALPANILVVVLVPLAMLFSLIAGVAGMLFASLAGWLAWPASLLLTYMLDTAHVLSRTPHIFIQQLGLSLVQMLGLYCCIVILTASLRYRNRIEMV